MKMFLVVEVEGKDAGGFLDRVTAGTVRRLAVGQGAPGLLLTGQSRMIAQFDLLRLEERRFWLVAPAACAAALAGGLERLHFAEELGIRLTETRAAAVPGNGARGRIFPWERRGERIGWPSGAEGFACETGAAAVPPGWDFARIGAGIPWPGLDWDETTPALEAGLLHAIDRDKGCYPGQEVVERSLNVGHPARALIAVEGEGELAAGSKVALVPQGEGTVRSVAMHGRDTRAFVLVPWSFRAAAPAHFRQLRG